MFRTKEDFINEWASEKALTIQVLESLTDEKLSQAIEENHSTLGWLGWHLTTTIPQFASIVGIQGEDLSQKTPDEAAVILETYKKVSAAVLNEVENSWADEDFTQSIDFFGNPSTKGYVLRMLVSHQTHHRGQMTVLLRQAGLSVPGIYGPTKEQQQS